MGYSKRCGKTHTHREIEAGAKDETERGYMMSENLNGADFFENVAQVIENARSFVGRTADLTMCLTYFEVGRMIVEEEQGGKARAEYGKKLLAELSRYLKERVGKGFSETTLKNARQFYRVYAPSIRQALHDELKIIPKKQISQAMLGELKSQSMLTKLTSGEFNTLAYPVTLSWSHYLILMRIKNDDERRFYEIEATRQQWDYRYLGRQYGSSLYPALPENYSVKMTASP
jgi:hypothetical protein